MIKFLIFAFLICKYRNLTAMMIWIVNSGIGDRKLIIDQSSSNAKLYQAVKLALAGDPKVPKPMTIDKMKIFALCNFDDPDFLLLFLCNPDVLKYTSDTMSYTLWNIELIMLK